MSDPNICCSPSITYVKSDDNLTPILHRTEPKDDPLIKKINKSRSAKIGQYTYYSPPIGTGTYSKVYIGHKNDSKEYVAIKCINSNSLKKISFLRIQREISLLKGMSHPNIIKFYDAFTDISGTVYIVTEYCNYGSLDKFIRKKNPKILTESNIKELIIQLRDGMRHLIEHNILHRDMKPENILLSLDKNGKKVVKIADFGFAKCIDIDDIDSLTKTLCGTPMYLAPEVVNQKKYTLVSDLWSIGVILYQIFFGILPFEKPRNILELGRNLQEMGLTIMPIPKMRNGATISSQGKDMLQQLLKIEPIERMTWGGFFSDPWFASFTSQSVLLNTDALTISTYGVLSLDYDAPNLKLPQIKTVINSRIGRTKKLTQNDKDEPSDIINKRSQPIDIPINKKKKIYDDFSSDEDKISSNLSFSNIRKKLNPRVIKNLEKESVPIEIKSKESSQSEIPQEYSKLFSPIEIMDDFIISSCNDSRDNKNMSLPLSRSPILYSMSPPLQPMSAPIESLNRPNEQKDECNKKHIIMSGSFRITEPKNSITQWFSSSINFLSESILSLSFRKADH